jgi:hypothetical protein
MANCFVREYVEMDWSIEIAVARHKNAVVAEGFMIEIGRCDR